MSLLDMQAVHFAYGDVHVLCEIDLQVQRGEVVGVVGPNGAGKTTLLRLASGLLRPAAGSIRLDGEPVEALPRRLAARRIAGVAAEESVPFAFTVQETVAMGRHPWRGAFGPLSPEDETRIEEAIEAADLGHVRNRSLQALSSGERQRAAMARCLVQGGDLVLLDEPTSHLDLGRRLRMLEVFRVRARRHHQGILAALHDLNLAAAVADRLVLLVAGRVAAEGDPSDVLTAATVGESFGAAVHVLAHPDTGGPVIVPEQGEAHA